jgi:phage gpG-like protein
MSLEFQFPMAKLEKLHRVLAQLDQLPRRVAEIAAPAITIELQKQFAQGRDPHGRKWRKLATGKASHLEESGKLRSKTRAAPMPGGRRGVRILFGSRARIAGFHQTGTKRMPARRILPDKGMPASWAMALTRAHRQAFQQIVRTG